MSAIRSITHTKHDEVPEKVRALMADGATQIVATDDRDGTGYWLIASDVNRDEDEDKPQPPTVLAQQAKGATK